MGRGPGGWPCHRRRSHRNQELLLCAQQHVAATSGAQNERSWEGVCFSVCPLTHTPPAVVSGPEPPWAVGVPSHHRGGRNSPTRSSECGLPESSGHLTALKGLTANIPCLDGRKHTHQVEEKGHRAPGGCPPVFARGQDPALWELSSQSPSVYPRTLSLVRHHGLGDC